MSDRPGSGVLLPAALCLSLLLPGALRAAEPAPAPAPKGEASGEQLRDRLADRLKEDAAALKLSTRPAGAAVDVKTANPVDLRARARRQARGGGLRGEILDPLGLHRRRRARQMGPTAA
ncbi:hypothetical protein ACFJIX_01260 [Roseateles sp. UC29_93]|uniref:hypothetical protein n=1 Tax=Roseateles sp. UC29_93 TaxID=3350177 RepID=UPI00366FF41F